MNKRNIYHFLAAQVLLPVLLLFSAPCAYGQQGRLAVSGTVRDSVTGEDLASAVIAVTASAASTAANAYGYWSLSLPRGSYKLTVSMVGYRRRDFDVVLSQNDVRLDVLLSPEAKTIDEIVVRAAGRNPRISDPGMSVNTLSGSAIKKIPALMGEIDPLKALQLLPGVQATVEGSSGFSVRGGGYDQNLMLLDETTIYSCSHMMGFFSVFNNDAVRDVKLYKGDIPAQYGGRISSLVEIRSREGNSRRFCAQGGIGTISSRLTLEGPIGGKVTWLVSGRRTYADLFLKLASDKNLRSSKLYFYDTNTSLSWRAGNRDRMFLSGYLGRDVAKTKIFNAGFGNMVGSLRWNHIYSPRLFSNITLWASRYDYLLGYEGTSTMAVEWRSRIADFGAKGDFEYRLNPDHTLHMGFQTTLHRFSPGEGGGTGESSIFSNIRMPHQNALEDALYVSAESKFGRLALRYGVRLSGMQNIGNGDTVKFLENYQVTRKEVIRAGAFYKSQWRLEPRLAAVFNLSPQQSIKASYTRTAQYIQLASNSAAGSPLDVWFQASPNVRPQLCDQFALGWFRNFHGGVFEASLEVYYKDMKSVVDFRDHASLLANPDLEQELRFGRGRAWGMEAMVRKTAGRLTGWVSYSLGRSRRQVETVNEGAWYRSPFDKPVNISVVLSWELSKRWSFSADWIFASGAPVTYPTGRFLVGDTYVPIYSGRNEYRYPAYHRLDVGATWMVSRPSRRVQSELNFSMYNAYGRRNVWTVLFSHQDDRPDVAYAERVYLFTFVPSVTWNFKF